MACLLERLYLRHMVYLHQLYPQFESEFLMVRQACTQLTDASEYVSKDCGEIFVMKILKKKTLTKTRALHRASTT